MNFKVGLSFIYAFLIVRNPFGSSYGYNVTIILPASEYIFGENSSAVLLDVA